MDRAWSAAHADFLSGLSPMEARELTARACRLEVAKREHLFQAGDTANSVYVVIRGCIKLYQLAPSGKEIILWFSFPGEIFGIAETMRAAEREIYAEASVDSEILALTHQDFLDFLGANPEAAMQAVGILSARVRTLGAALVDIASDDVETRLLRLLMRFAAGTRPHPCTEKRQAELCVNVPMTHADFANLIGATRQTVTTTLSALRHRNVVRVVVRHLHIVDAQQLRRLLEQAGR